MTAEPGDDLDDPERPRVLALDVGDKTLGLAVSDATRTIAQGLPTIRRTSLPKDLAAVALVIARHEVGRLVVGWPLMLDGKVGVQARKVGVFADALAQHTGLRVERVDERLTTVAAERALLSGNVSRARRREVVDMVAANLILQSWLDTRKHAQAHG